MNQSVRRWISEWWWCWWFLLLPIDLDHYHTWVFLSINKIYFPLTKNTGIQFVKMLLAPFCFWKIMYTHELFLPGNNSDLKKKLYRHMNCSCAIFFLGKALAGTLHVYFNMLKAPINLKHMQITSTCHSVILFILKVQQRLLHFQNSSQFSEEENSETTF